MAIRFRLQAILQEKGMTQRELAGRMNMRPNTINHLCSFKASGIYFETLEQLCKTLEVELQDLIEIKDENL